jgi:2-oxoacid:acceptor oxidoreductase delta subunit (pyruvate/2-ketoisovalerate family)
MSRKVCYPLVGAGPQPSRRSATERIGDFDPVWNLLDPAQAKASALRCLAANDCVDCEVCELLCPDQCITRDPESGDIVIDLKYCKGCGLCAHFCPRNAIEMVIEKSELGG